MPYLADYGLFLAETLTILMAVIVAAAAIAGLTSRGRGTRRERLEVRRLNAHYEDLEAALKAKLLDKKKLRAERKARTKARKQQKTSDKRRIYVLDFTGDIRASRVESLREEITGLLMVATAEDEVVVRLESPGGLVPHYGLAASQLARVRERGIKLTVAIDRVAASGGYLMACVADRILTAPFAIIGSIGVVAQIPNFHRLLKRNDIDYEQLTAGEYKRTVTMFGEITEQGREKALEELRDTHALFKDFIHRYRPQLDVDRVATGEYWLGEHALQLQLVDGLQTSDDYLLEHGREAELLHLHYHHKTPLSRRLSIAFDAALAHLKGVR